MRFAITNLWKAKNANWSQKNMIWRWGSVASLRGVTLIELLIVITVVGVLAMIAVPSFVATSNSMLQTSTISMLVNDLNQARNEAIKRNLRVLVCVRNSSGTGCASGTNWQAGWLICSDADSNDQCDAASASNPNPIIVRAALNSNLSLTASAASVRFNANSSAGSVATLTLAGTGAGMTTRTVAVALTGHVSK